MIDPIRIEFDVACTPEHAFDTWTTRIGDWWPSSHSVSGLPEIEVVLEGWAGGRIFERAPGGAEHDWGEITLWEPPARLGYLWHLRSDRVAATDVEIRFVARDDSTTGSRSSIEAGNGLAPTPRRGATETAQAGTGSCRTS